MPPINLLGAHQKRPLTPEEQEQQKKINDYKAATNKILNQKGRPVGRRPGRADGSCTKKEAEMG
jgi:hypothetical protein